MIVPASILRDALSIACKVPSRYAIHGVHLKRIGPIACRASATDGRRLVRFQWEEPAQKVLPYGRTPDHPLPDSAGDAELILSGTSVKALLRAHKPTALMRKRFAGAGFVVIPDVGVEPHPHQRMVHVIVGDAVGFCPVEAIADMSFPDSEGLFESVLRKPVSGSVMLNSHNLASLAKAIANGCGEDPNTAAATTIEARGEGDPLVFRRQTPDGIKVEALLMPVTGD